MTLDRSKNTSILNQAKPIAAAQAKIPELQCDFVDLFDMLAFYLRAERGMKRVIWENLLEALETLKLTDAQNIILQKVHKG